MKWSHRYAATIARIDITSIYSMSRRLVVVRQQIYKTYEAHTFYSMEIFTYVYVQRENHEFLYKVISARYIIEYAQAIWPLR